MIIINKNEGPKISYEVTGTRICFIDDLSLNLSKRLEDWAVHIDICADSDNTLVIGAAAGRAYVAQIDIPPREYEDPEPAGEGEEPQPPAPKPLDMDKVTLTLWATDIE